jgi:hypothetical protein
MAAAIQRNGECGCLDVDVVVFMLSLLFCLAHALRLRPSSTLTPEGTVFFPNEPIVRVTAELHHIHVAREAQLAQVTQHALREAALALHTRHLLYGEAQRLEEFQPLVSGVGLRPMRL